MYIGLTEARIKAHRYNPDFEEWETYWWDFQRWRHVWVWVRPDNPNAPRPTRMELRVLIDAIIEKDNEMDF